VGISISSIHGPSTTVHSRPLASATKYRVDGSPEEGSK
jgi:hypothetical protein